MVPEFEPVEITAYNDLSNQEEEEEDDGDVDDDDDEFNDVEEITDEVLNSSLNSGTWRFKHFNHYFQRVNWCFQGLSKAFRCPL